MRSTGTNGFTSVLGDLDPNDAYSTQVLTARPLIAYLHSMTFLNCLYSNCTCLSISVSCLTPSCLQQPKQIDNDCSIILGKTRENLFKGIKGIQFIVMYPPKHSHNLPPLAGLYTWIPFQSPWGYSRATGSI